MDTFQSTPKWSWVDGQLPRLAILAYALAGGLLLLAGPLKVAAIDPDLNMRIESEVFRIERKQDQILSNSLSLFHQGVAYDYLIDHKEATLFDPARARIILLDSERRLKCELALVELHSFVNDLRAWASSQKRNPLLQFASQPKFEVSFQEETGELSLKHRLISYRVETVAEESGQATAACKELWDLSSQLNAVMQPGGIPPFVRMELNRELATRGRLPKRVELTIYDTSPLRRSESTIHSIHKIANRLTESDRRLILNIQTWTADFEQIDFASYRTAVRLAAHAEPEEKPAK